MKKLLITGASGLFGSNAILTARGRYDLTGVYNRNRLNLDGARWEQVDLTDATATAALLDRVRPDYIVHAAADANIDHCEEDRAYAFRSNVEIPRNLARYSAETGARLVHFSTDAFFEGYGKTFTEEDAPTPMNYYGETKLQAEEAVRSVCPSALIVRTNFYGWNSQPKPSLAEWILARLASRTPTPLFSDVIFSPILVNTLAEAIYDLLDAGKSGIYHVAGSEPISKLDFGTRLCELFKDFGIDRQWIRPTPVNEVHLKARRSHAMALSVKKLQTALPHSDLSINTGLKRFKALLDQGHAHLLKGKDWKFYS